VEALEKLIPVDRTGKEGDVHITLVDVVSIQNIQERLPYPSICYSVWESTEYPSWFIEKLKLFDQLWVPSEWQRACSIAQGIPEEFVKVIPEGVDPDIYKPAFFTEDPAYVDGKGFTFCVVGQWQPRKSTLEIIQAFQRAFPANQHVRLELSVDTLFPSDQYGSTEERLVAYGINDPRISVIHFEDREAYIRRLQSAHCFVSCARSEGWGLPLCEAMACGIPSITADFGGSTEYAMEAINVRISKLIKPFGIYGNWDVPGMWAEPDYNHLVECMQDVYNKYAAHKEKALKTADMIRTKFSWDAAAAKAMKIIGEIPETIPGSDPVPAASPEEAIRKYAAERGFKINGSIVEEKCIFAVGTWPNSSAKMETLMETIKQIKMLNFPVLITTHYPIPPHIVEEVDYVVYDKNNVLSGDWRATYWRTGQNGAREEKKCRIPYHGVACLNSIRNAVEFCYNKFDRMYYLEYDSEVDLEKFVEEVRATAKPFTGVKYEGDRGLRTDLWSGEINWLYNNIPVINTWEEYKAGYGEDEFNNEYPLEMWMKKRLQAVYDQMHLFDFEITNRFDQVDREIWDDDVFRVHFYDGPYLQIDGISNREYDVTFGNPINGDRFFHLKQKVGTWGRPSIKYYRDWTVKATLTKDGVTRTAFEHKMDLAGKRVLISLGSKALGDTLAWMPYVDAFQKKHNCHIICSTWWNTILDYPEIEFAEPGSKVENIYATYEVGCYDEQPDKNPANWRTVPLQKVAADILGIDYEPIRCKLKCNKPIGQAINKPYVCFSEFSTMQNKFWNNPGAWQKTIDYLVSLGYECISISSEPSQLKNITKHNGQSIDDTIRDIAGADFYVGLNHGPSWVAYSLGIPFVLITGVSEEWNDVPNPYRVAINNDVCGIGCFNDPSLPINRGWEWCPRGKNYACTREITPEMVAQTIDRLMADYGLTENGKEEDNATEKGIVG
jgi:autotransporter strand-loop-strand O-heptosyltransferase